MDKNQMAGLDRMSKLLINEPPLMVLPSLAVAIGLNEAIVLQQLHYWLQTTKHHHDGLPWVYNTAEGWKENFPFWSEPTIRRIFTTLRDKGVVLTGNYNKVGFDRTLWYSIDYKALEEIAFPFDEIVTPSTQIDKMEARNLITPIPETTQETTTLKKEEDEDGEKPVTSGDVHKLWQQNMPGMLTAIIVDDINDLIETYGAEEVALAITSAVRNNGRSIRYVQKVLESRAAAKDRQPAKDEKRKPGPVTVYNQYTGKMEQVIV
jgi:DnaD/phage-associated family protein